MTFLLACFVDIWHSEMRPVHGLKTSFNKHLVTGTISQENEVTCFIYILVRSVLLLCGDRVSEKWRWKELGLLATNVWVYSPCHVCTSVNWGKRWRSVASITLLGGRLHDHKVVCSVPLTAIYMFRCTVLQSATDHYGGEGGYVRSVMGGKWK